MFTGPLDPVSNRATWTEQVRAIDTETGEAMSLTDAQEITVEIRRQRDCRPSLSASLTGATVSLIDSDLAFEFTFTADQMRTLCAGTYDIGCTVKINDETDQLIIGTLPVLDGIVR